jgi:hypothetical protein
MKILVTRSGKGAGSWQIRGEQIGQALGAVVKLNATLNDMRDADVVLVVKRVSDTMLSDLRSCGKPWVYDIIDAYPQPECSSWSKDQSLDWLRSTIKRLGANRIIWPNAKMRSDACDDGPVVYHHARPGLRVAPIRDSIRTIGYEGAPHYLDGWMEAIAALRVPFLVNPTDLTACDILFALRGPKWNGYPQRAWKSNVKLANAHASGLPFIGMFEEGYGETAVGGEMFVYEPEDLAGAFNALCDVKIRTKLQLRFVAATKTLDHAAADTLCALRFS